MPTRILGSDVDVRLNNYALVGMAQSVEWTPNFNAQDIYQLGDTAVVDRALEFDLTGSHELMDTGDCRDPVCHTQFSSDDSSSSRKTAS